jgi:hypothetical protein
MPINPAIAMGTRGIELADPLAQYGRVAAIQNAQQQNQLAQLQMQQAQREQESTNALNRAYAEAYNPTTGDVDINKLRQSLSTGGFGSKLPGIEKQLGELRTQQLTQRKAEVDLVDSKLKQARSFLDTINPADPNAPQQYIAWHEANHKDPVLGPLLASRGVTADQSRAQIAQAIQQGPQAFAELLNRSKLGTEKFIELNKPTVTTVNRSGQTDLVSRPGLGGAPVVIGTYADVPLPATVEAQKARIAAAGRAPQQPVAPTITQIVDPTNQNQMITIDARRYAGGGIGSPGVLGVGGKEPAAAVRENKAEAGKTQLADDLENLRASFRTLDQMRAIPSTERGALSNIAAATAATGPGQVAGRFFSTEAQVEREIINSARTRLVNSIKNATGMSAQQLNSNVELQTMLKSISDPGQPIQAALRIIDDIENAYVKGAGMPKKPSGQAPAAAPATTPAPPAGFTPDKK